MTFSSVASKQLSINLKFILCQVVQKEIIKVAGITKMKSLNAWMRKNKERIRARAEDRHRKKGKVATLRDRKAQEVKENPVNLAVNCILYRKKSPGAQWRRGITVCDGTHMI